MDQETSSDASGSSAIRRSQSVKNNENNGNKEDNQNQIAATTAADIESLPDIFKLNVDCFEELFDYLSLEDLDRIAQTCKRLERIAGHCLKETYPTLGVTKRFDTFMTTDGYSINHLPKYIKNLRIFQDITFDLTVMQSLRHIEFYTDAWKACENYGFGRIQQILNNVEHVTFKNIHQLDGDIYENVLRFCKKMTSLSIEYLSKDAGFNNNWMRQEYPELKYFKYCDCYGKLHPTELKVFFQRNQQIKTFATEFENLRLLKVEGAFDELSGLDVLAISFKEKIKHKELSILKSLYKCGLYKRLHIYFQSTYIFKQRNPFKDLQKLTKLYIPYHHSKISLSSFTDLEELYISDLSIILDLEASLTNLTNLTRIEIVAATNNHISIFVRRIATLNKILVFCLNNDELDVMALNKERSSLVNARKVTIYVKERVYLRTKWTMKQTEWRFIQVKRINSYE